MRLVRGKGPLERTIEWATSSPWSHVATLCPDGRLVEAKEFKGIRIVPGDTYPDGDWYTVSCSAEVALKAVGWALTRVGESYGWGDVARDWNRPLVGAELLHRVHLTPVDCSGLVCWAFQQAGFTITRRPFASPADLGFSVALQPLKENA